MEVLFHLARVDAHSVTGHGRYSLKGVRSHLAEDVVRAVQVGVDRPPIVSAKQTAPDAPPLVGRVPAHWLAVEKAALAGVAFFDQEDLDADQLRL